MAEKVKIQIEISEGFTKENYVALKAMLDAYVGEFITVSSFPTSGNPFADRRMNNDLPFVCTFLKVEKEQEFC